MRETAKGRGRPSRRTVPGGCVFVRTIDLAMVWWAYRERLIQARDFRAWCACRLEVAARKRLLPGREPRYTMRELARRAKVGGRSIRGSLRRLGALGLVTFSKNEIRFATSPDELAALELSSFFELFESLPNRKRFVPVPRRILRLMSQGATPAVIATIIGHLIRCLYSWPDEGFKCSGSCKASWVASVFGISLRSAKSARKELEGLGWLVRGASSQRRLNAFGPDISINLDWSMPKAPAGTEFAPPPAVCETEFAPPSGNKIPPSGENKNQEPASRVRTGVSGSEDGEGEPTLRDVTPRDLGDTSRLLTLFEQAVAAKVVTDSECERLHFFAAAEHARASGKINPCGLFVWLIRTRSWAFLSQGDEDRARVRFKGPFLRRSA